MSDSLHEQPVKKRPLSLKVSIAITGFCLPLIFAQPTMAGLSDVATTISPFLDGIFGVDISPYIDYLDQAEQLYSAINDKNISGVIEGAEATLGKLGYPIPGEIPQAIEDVASAIETGSVPFNPNAQEVKDVLQSEVIYQNQMTFAEVQLGEQGQEDLFADKTTIAKLVTQSGKDSQSASGAAAAVQALGDSAQTMPISQDILKMMALQNGEISSQLGKISAQGSYSTAILQGIYTEVQDTRVNGLVQNQGISTLVRNDQKRNWEAHIDEIGQRAYNARLSAQGFGYGMPTTSSSTSLFDK
jgi:hypothetical protein